MNRRRICLVLINDIGRPKKKKGKNEKEKNKENVLLYDSLSICQKMDALVMRSEYARAIRPIQSSFRMIIMIIIIIIVIRLLFIKANSFTATKRHCKLSSCTANNVIVSFKWKWREKCNDTVRTRIEQLNQTTLIRLNRRRWDNNKNCHWTTKMNDGTQSDQEQKKGRRIKIGSRPKS